MPFRLYRPVNPFVIRQGFGENADYYAKFKDANGNPMKGHDGLDLYATHGEPVYAGHDGMAHFAKDPHGGEGILIRSTVANDYPTNTGKGYFTTLYWHLIGDTDPNYPAPIPSDGKEYKVKAGDLIGYADNTGAPYESSGDHLHLGLYVIDEAGVMQNLPNGFNGRIDPTPYLQTMYAQDVPREIVLLTNVIALLKRIYEYWTTQKTGQ